MIPNPMNVPRTHSVRIRRGIAAGAAALAVITGLASCNRSGTTAPAETVAARIGNETIPVREVEEEIAYRVSRGAIVPPREKLLEDMIERRLLVKRARDAGLDSDPEIRRSLENLLISRYKEDHLRAETAALQVSDEEIAARYQENPDRFRHPAKARLAILQAALPASLDPEQREETLARMREARELAVAKPADGPGFGTLAVRYSEDDVTRHRGGDTGWLNENVDYRWPAEVVRAGFALSSGETSEPIVCGDAVYLVRKLDERPSVAVPLAQVGETLRREIHSEKLRAVQEAFATRIREGIRIEAFPDTLAGIQIPLPDAKGAVALKDEPPAMP